MTPTIAFREYVQLWDEFALAFGGERRDLEQIAGWLVHITYLGKRGSFIQLLAPPSWHSTDGNPPVGFILLEGPAWTQEGVPEAFRLGLLQRLDDWGPNVTFAHLNIYDPTKMQVGRERLRVDVILPYHLGRAGRGFTLYVCEE